MRGAKTNRTETYLGRLSVRYLSSEGKEPYYLSASIRGLLASGKPKKVALVACMRKLLVTLNSMLKHRSPWRGSDSGSRLSFRLTSNTVGL